MNNQFTLSNKSKNRILFFPIKILLFFLITSELFFIIGPIDYSVDNMPLTISYLLLVNILMFYGYKRGICKGGLYRDTGFSNKNKGLKFIIFLSLISLSIKLSNVVGSFSLLDIYQTVIKGIIAPKEAYAQKLATIQITNLSYFFMVISPITTASIPLGIFYWNKLPRLYKILVLTLILGNIAYWLTLGTRKGIFDILLVGLFSIYAAHPQLIINKGSQRRIIIFFSILLCLFISYFIWSNMSRFQVDGLSEMSDRIRNIKSSYHNISIDTTIILSSIENYLCQGYYALSCALKEFINGEVCFTYGFGNNFFTINILERFDIDIIPDTYQGILLDKYHIDPYASWHSIYVWLANDFTFIGVPFVMYISGYFLAITWKSAINRNFYAVPIFILFAQMIAYSYANNQVLSFSFIEFFFWISLFLIKGKQSHGT